MSIQSVLAAGFLFLGGIPFLAFPFFIRDMYWLILIGLLLLFLGGIPLFACLWQELDRHFPKQNPESDKEDNP